MAILTPKQNESRNDFMTRCIADQASKGVDKDEAEYLCFCEWDESKKLKEVEQINVKKMNSNEIINK